MGWEVCGIVSGGESWRVEDFGSEGVAANERTRG